MKRSRAPEKTFSRIKIIRFPDSADGKSDSAKNDATAPETKKSVNTENPAGRKNAADNNSAERNAGRSTSEDGAVFDADAIFEYRKEELNKRYEKMFEMKSRLDEINKESDALWREYYAMRESYDRQYKRNRVLMGARQSGDE